MNKLKEKMSLLKAGKIINNIKGINNISLFTEKPMQIGWYLGELNHLDNDIPYLYRLPYDIDIRYLSSVLEKESGGESHFIMEIFGVIPVYISFYIDSFYDFISSFYREMNTKDITLFFFNRRKMIDIFLTENELEIRILDQDI